jgi:hypothetical protein
MYIALNLLPQTASAMFFSPCFLRFSVEAHLKYSFKKDCEILIIVVGFEIEITMKLAKLKVKFFEVGISYNGRTVEEGKKIKFVDGLRAIYAIFKYKIF